MNSLDFKRYMLDDRVSTWSYGYYQIPVYKECHQLVQEMLDKIC